MQQSGLTLGDILRCARKRLGWSEQYLADTVGSTQAYISALETGRIINPSFRSLGRIASQLKLSIDEIYRATEWQNRWP